MTLRSIIKSAASASVTVPANEAAFTHSKLDKDFRNRIMPWLAGRRKNSKPEKKAFDYSDLGDVSTDLNRGSVKSIYNSLVDGSLNSLPSENSVAGNINKYFGNMGTTKARQSAATNTASPAAATPWNNPGGYVDAQLKSYNDLTPGQKILNLGAQGLDGATLGLSGYIGDTMGWSPKGPSVWDSLLSIPSTIAANGEDSTYRHTTDANNLARLMAHGLDDDAKLMYPEIYDRWQRGSRGMDLLPWNLR